MGVLDWCGGEHQECGHACFTDCIVKLNYFLVVTISAVEYYQIAVPRFLVSCGVITYDITLQNN